MQRDLLDSVGPKSQVVPKPMVTSPSTIRKKRGGGNRDLWSTPRPLANTLVSEYRLTLDVAASADNAVCQKFWTAQDNALSRPWPVSERIWCNPPYSKITPWVDRALEYADNGGECVLLLLPRSGSSRWLSRLWRASSRWDFEPRIRFVPATGVKESTPMIGNELFCLGSDFDGKVQWLGVRSGIDGVAVYTCHSP